MRVITWSSDIRTKCRVGEYGVSQGGGRSRSNKGCGWSATDRRETKKRGEGDRSPTPNN